MLNLDRLSGAIRVFQRESLLGTVLGPMAADTQSRLFIVASGEFKRCAQGAKMLKPSIIAFSDNPSAIDVFVSGLRSKFDFVADDGRIRWIVLDSTHRDDSVMTETPFAQWLMSRPSSLNIWGRPTYTVITDYLNELGYDINIHFIDSGTLQNLNTIYHYVFRLCKT